MPNTARNEHRSINEDRLFSLLPHFFRHPSGVLLEIAQNAARAGAKNLSIDFESQPVQEATPTTSPAVAVTEEDELKIPDRFKKELETEKVEKFKVKPGMQRAFQTIRKVEPKRWHEQRPQKRMGRSRSYQPDERKQQAQPVAPRKTTLKLQEGTTVKEFAELISVKWPM